MGLPRDLISLFLDFATLFISKLENTQLFTVLGGEIQTESEPGGNFPLLQCNMELFIANSK